MSGIFLYMVLSAITLLIIGHCFIQRLFDSLRVYGPTRRCSAPTPSSHSALKSPAIIRMCLHPFGVFLDGLVRLFNVVVCASRVWEVYTHQHDFLSVDVNRCYCTLTDVLCPLNLYDSDAVFVFTCCSTHAAVTLVLRAPCCRIPRTANTQIQELHIPSIVTFQTSHTACLHCTCWRQQQKFIGAVKLTDKNASHPSHVQFGSIL